MEKSQTKDSKPINKVSCPEFGAFGEMFLSRVVFHLVLGANMPRALEATVGLTQEWSNHEA